MLEMSKVISKKTLGKGKPKVSSAAPEPASSFSSGGSVQVKKRQEDKSLDDIRSEYRSRYNMIS
jgi:hypothetical protein